MTAQPTDRTRSADDPIEGAEPRGPASPDSSIYIDEVHGHERRFSRLLDFTSSSTKAAALMLVAAIAALVVANVGAHEPFLAFWHTEVGFVVGGSHATMSLAHVINDILMAVFFLLVGLEIKYEMTVGELTDVRQAALPVIAAVGGVLAPIVIYLAFGAGSPEAAGGWGVPTATDIAFALGILALLGDRVPNGVRVFLSTLAVADDIIAILVIAIFYGQSPSLEWLAGAAVVIAVLVALNRAHVYALVPYLIAGIVLWYCVFMSGVHSTIAGVLLALAIPTGSRVRAPQFAAWAANRAHEAADALDESAHIMSQKDYLASAFRLGRVARQAVPPAVRLEHALYPWVYFAILPLFALTNADVQVAGMDFGQLLASPALLGVFFGLLIGKPVGIMLLSAVTVKARIASLPEGATWLHMVGAGVLGGVGFTMAIFVANLAFADATLIATAKLGILAASAVAGVAGFVILLVAARRSRAE